MIGSIIGGALSIGGSIAGGIFGARQARNLKRQLKREEEKNETWYNRRYNEDATQRADAQRMLTRITNEIKQRNKAMAGRSAVMGGDDGVVAREKALNAQALADATSNIVALGEARKDTIESQYRERADQLTNALMQADQAKANAIAGAVKGVFGAGVGIANGLSGSIPGEQTVVEE
jgi:hypothetical protein